MILLIKILNVNNQRNSKWLNVLIPKQILQRLLIPLAEVKAENLSENLLNEIRQIIHSLYEAKEITKTYATI